MLAELEDCMSACNRGIPNHDVARSVTAQQDASLPWQFEFIIVQDQCPPVGLSHGPGTVTTLEYEFGTPKTNGRAVGQTGPIGHSLSVDGHVTRRIARGNEVPGIALKHKMPHTVGDGRLLVQVDVIVAGTSHRDLRLGQDVLLAFIEAFGEAQKPSVLQQLLADLDGQANGQTQNGETRQTRIQGL